MSRPYSATPYAPDPAVYPGAVRIPFLRRGKTQLIDGSDITENKLSLATLTFKAPLPSVEAQRSLFMAGAQPLEYDGSRVHEAGFNLYPEGMVATTSAGGVGALVSASTYQLIFMYEWEDAKGVTHRGAPSVPLSVVMGVADNTITTTVPFLRLTDKQHPGAVNGAVRIVCFRTASNGTIFFRDPPNAAQLTGVRNSLSAVIPASHVSWISDALLAANEILYTTGGGLENEAFPSCTVVCNHQRRVFMVTQEEQSFVQYTDEIDERFLAPATNQIYRIPVPVEGGSVVGLASMDEKLIIFCQRRIYFISGEGPNRLGQQNGYSLPQLCSSKMGALGGCHEAIVLTPDGLWFMSSTRGLRLLTRGLSIAQIEDDYLGTESDGMIPDPVNTIRAATIDAKNQVRWYLSGESGVVVYDYMQHQWSLFTNHVAIGGVVSTRDAFWHSDGSQLFSSNATPTGLDNTTRVTQVAETAWIALAGIEGLQRVYALQLLAECVSKSTILIEVGYDYNETYSESATYTQSSALNPLQIMHQLTTQQCDAVRFRFTITAIRDSGVYRSDVVALDVDDITSAEIDGEVVGFDSSATGTLLAATSGIFPAGTIYMTDVVGTFQNGESATIGGGVPFTVNSAPSAAIVVTDATAAIAAGQVLIGVPSGNLATVVTSVAGSGGYVITVTGGLQDGESFEIDLTGNGESVRLTGFALSVGVKSGLMRLSASKRF